jgi:hypothetical protein
MKNDMNKNKAHVAAGNNRKKWEGNKRKASQVKKRLSDEEVSLLKVSNPDDWFLSTESIPSEVFKPMSQKEKKLMRKFRETENRAVKAVRTAGVTVPDRSSGNGTHMGPIVVLTANQAFPIIQMLNQPTFNNQLVLTMPTVQFRRAAHRRKDVAYQDK